MIIGLDEMIIVSIQIKLEFDLLFWWFEFYNKYRRSHQMQYCIPHHCLYVSYPLFEEVVLKNQQILV